MISLSRYSGGIMRRARIYSGRNDDRFHTVKHYDRLDVLAHKYLGNSHLDWTIADYNNLRDPGVLVVGSILRIPSVVQAHRMLPG